MAEIWLVKVVCLAMYIGLITHKNLLFSYVLLDTYLPYSTVGYLELQFSRLANQSQNCNSTELQTMELQSRNSFPAKFLPIPINLSLPLCALVLCRDNLRDASTVIPLWRARWRMLALLVTTLVTFRLRKESPKRSIMIILSPLLSSLSLSLWG